jgi:hypothetical protein
MAVTVLFNLNRRNELRSRIGDTALSYGQESRPLEIRVGKFAFIGRVEQERLFFFAESDVDRDNNQDNTMMEAMSTSVHFPPPLFFLASY